jgi:hypothetical protein
MFGYVSSFLAVAEEVVKSRCSSHVRDVDGLEMMRRCVAMVRIVCSILFCFQLLPLSGRIQA